MVESGSGSRQPHPPGAAAARPLSRPQSAPARTHRPASSWRGRPQSATSAKSAATARPHSASVRRGVVGNWGDGEEVRIPERKPPLPAQARARPQSARPASEVVHDPNDFTRNECYQRLRKRYERSHGGQGNGETGEPEGVAWYRPPRANVHCPACLLEELALVQELEEARKLLDAEDAAWKKRLQDAEDKVAQERAESKRFERALLAKLAERDDENTALKEQLAELRRQMADLESRHEVMKAKVFQADAHELVWKADRARLQHTIRDLRARAEKLQKQVDSLEVIDFGRLAEMMREMVRRRPFLLCTTVLVGSYSTAWRVRSARTGTMTSARSGCCCRCCSRPATSSTSTTCSSPSSSSSPSTSTRSG